VNEGRERVPLGAIVVAGLVICVLALVDRYADHEGLEVAGTVVGPYKHDSYLPEPTLVGPNFIHQRPTTTAPTVNGCAFHSRGLSIHHRKVLSGIEGVS